jgi:hypothetical protein
MRIYYENECMLQLFGNVNKMYLAQDLVTLSVFYIVGFGSLVYETRVCFNYWEKISL